MKYIRNFICFLIVVSVLFTGVLNIEAKTLGQLKKELSDAETKYKNNQNDKKQTEEEIASTKARIDELNREKVKINEEMDKIKEELKKLALDIDKMQKEIKSIMNYYQLSSSNSLYLEYIFNASSYTDFIYRMAVSEQLSVYRKKTIDKYNKLIEDNNKKIEELAAKKVSLDKLESELSIQLTKLGDNLESISEASVSIQDEIKELKESVKLYEETYKCKNSDDLDTCKKDYYDRLNQNSGGSWNYQIYSDIYRPVKSARINANYGYSEIYGSTFHYGMDIGVGHGTPVYSIGLGYVSKLTYKANCGGNMLYINYTTLDGQRFTAGYFHLASFNVSEGELVGPNTVVGYSGGAPWIETWDRCSTGPHLHLQFGSGHMMSDYFWYSNFQARSFDPRQIISFPPVGSYFNGR